MAKERAMSSLAVSWRRLVWGWSGDGERGVVVVSSSIDRFWLQSGWVSALVEFRMEVIVSESK